MNKTLIGPNAAIRYLKAYDAHVAYWHQVNPAYLLAYVDQKDHTKYIQEYAAEFSDSMIVARIQHPKDGGFHEKPTGPNDTRNYVASPQDYHTDYGWLGQIDNVILNVFYGPDGFADDVTVNRLVDWMLEYIPIAVQNKTKSVLFNWGKGQPRLFGGDMDILWGRVYQLASEHPELFYIGLHFYGPQDITKQIAGYISMCAKIGIKPLRVIGTEFGNDSGAGGSIEAVWEIEQVKIALAPYIQSGVLVGLTRFQDGNSGGWDHYGIENDHPYKDEIKRAALAGELNVQTIQPSLKLKDIIFGKSYRLRKYGDSIKAYPLPKANDPGVTPRLLPDNASVVILESTSTNGDVWFKISYKAFTGVYYIQAQYIDIKATMEIPAVTIVDDVKQAVETPPVLPPTPPVTAPAPKPVVIPETPVAPVVAPNLAYVSKSTSLLDCLKVIRTELDKAIQFMEIEQVKGLA